MRYAVSLMYREYQSYQFTDDHRLIIIRSASSKGDALLKAMENTKDAKGGLISNIILEIPEPDKPKTEP